MDRPRLIRGLRIALSAVFGILCLLLIVLWVRSYWVAQMILDCYFLAIRARALFNPIRVVWSQVCDTTAPTLSQKTTILESSTLSRSQTPTS